MRTVDLNCDVGEGCGNDAELMKYITSANIACGYHAGDVETMRRTVELAVMHDVKVGAHPGYPDRENFGRSSMSMSRGEVVEIVTKQISDLAEVCGAAGIGLHHVKPHGALYNQAAKDRELAATIAEAVARFDSSLVLYGLSGSYLISEAVEAGLKPASEVFADRTYQSDGTLTPRTEPNALIEKPDDAAAQVLQMIESRTVAAVTGETISIAADTVCIHGDTPNAHEFAARLRDEIERRGIAVRPI